MADVYLYFAVIHLLCPWGQSWHAKFLLHSVFLRTMTTCKLMLQCYTSINSNLQNEPTGGITRALERARYLGSGNLIGLGDLNRDCLSALGNFVCFFIGLSFFSSFVNKMFTQKAIDIVLDVIFVFLQSMNSY